MTAKEAHECPKLLMLCDVAVCPKLLMLCNVADCDESKLRKRPAPRRPDLGNGDSSEHTALVLGWTDGSGTVDSGKGNLESGIKERKKNGVLKGRQEKEPFLKKIQVPEQLDLKCKPPAKLSDKTKRIVVKIRVKDLNGTEVTGFQRKELDEKTEREKLGADLRTKICAERDGVAEKGEAQKIGECRGDGKNGKLQIDDAYKKVVEIGKNQESRKISELDVDNVTGAENSYKNVVNEGCRGDYRNGKLQIDGLCEKVIEIGGSPKSGKISNYNVVDITGGEKAYRNTNTEGCKEAGKNGKLQIDGLSEKVIEVGKDRRSGKISELGVDKIAGGENGYTNIGEEGCKGDCKFGNLQTDGLSVKAAAKSKKSRKVSELDVDKITLVENAYKNVDEKGRRGDGKNGKLQTDCLCMKAIEIGKNQHSSKISELDVDKINRGRKAYENVDGEGGSDGVKNMAEIKKNDITPAADVARTGKDRAGGRHKLPLMVKGIEKSEKARKVGGNVCIKNDCLAKFLQVLIGGVDSNPKDVDFLETAESRGLTFPRPRWWPPEGFEG